jgi:DegV family protein with EDD domain
VKSELHSLVTRYFSLFVMVHIVTDSTSDVPPDIARDLNITVIPAHVIFDGQSYDDCVTITREEFYQRLDVVKSLPTTAAPSPGAFAEAYQRLGGEIISVHVAGKFSGVLAAALSGAQMVPEAQVTLFDSGSVALGLGWQAILAARAAKDGQPIEQVIRLLESIRPRVRVYAALDTMEFLRRSGRVGWARAMLGQLLSIKPIVEARDGEVFQVERVRTRRSMIQRLKQMAFDLGPLQTLAVQHTRAYDDARAMADEFTTALPDLREPIVVCEATTAIGTHVGPKGLGVIAVVAE